MTPVPIQASILALADAHAGNRRQAEALAQAVGGPGTHACTLTPHAPWSWLAPRAIPGASAGFGTAFRQYLGSPPRVAIGCGRQAALATRLLRRVGSRVVQVLDPRIDPRLWDLVVVPEHDRARGGNVITLLGSLNPVDDAWLAQARADAGHPAESTLLLLGGPTAHAPVSHKMVQAALAALRDDSPSLRICASRRTPKDWRGLVNAVTDGGATDTWFSDADGANPYAGWLASAERIVCTPDSVNMLSEACATRAVVEIIAPDTATGRIRQFIDALRARGRVRAFGDAEPVDTTPLRETARVAADVRARLGL